MTELSTVNAVDPWTRFLEEGLLGAVPLINNARIETSAVRVGSHRVPVIINRTGAADCSWVASLRNAYGPYARAEASLVPMSPALKLVYSAATHVAEALLRRAALSGGVFLNNWLLSTNLHPPALTLGDLAPAVAELRRAEPTLPIVLRSLTPRLHADLLRELVASGCILLPSRQIWLLDDPASGDWRQRRDARADLALAQSTERDWRWFAGTDFSNADFDRALRLYQRLYRVQYPKFNPDYTESFLRIGVATGFLELVGLRRVGDETVSGVLGMIRRGNVSTCTLLGYDLDVPPSVGLYRRLALQSTLIAEANATTLHCSAGTGAFKFNRGAQPHVEFSAVWADHLPRYRRANLRALSAMLHRFVVPYLEAHHL